MSAAATTMSRPRPPADPQIRNSLTGARPNGVTLPCRVRLADGRTFSGELPAIRHRALQLGMLHADSDGLVEIAVGFRRDGKLTIPRRRYSQFLPGGKAGGPGWLEELLTTADRHCRRRGAEVFVAPPVRASAAGDKQAVTHTWALWVDVDKPGQLHRLWALLAERPCHLLVESGGSGGAHTYWLLEKPLPATKVVQSTGELAEPIERAHLRLLHHLGVDEDGTSVGDTQCLPAGTLVLTARGYRPIEVVRRGEQVLTHLGRWRRVSAVMSRKADTLTVTGHGHYGLEITANHPLFSRTRQVKRRRRPWIIAPEEWTPAREMEGRFWATPTAIEALPVPPVGGRGMGFDNHLWWLVGRWLGDGSIVAARRRKTPARGGLPPMLVLSCNDEERNALDERLRVLAPRSARRPAGEGELRWRATKQLTATVFKTGHKGLVEWLTEHFGRGAHGKRLPAFVFGMPAEWRAALLDGYVSADGFVSGNRHRTSSVSKELSLGIRQLAETLGQRSSFWRYPNPTTVIEGRTVQTHDSWHVQWTVEPKHEHCFADNLHSWLRVSEVAQGREDIEVFNLSVEEDESYVAEGIVVHNCQNRSRLMRLAGTVNTKTGRHARIIHADLELRRYRIEELVGDLPDPPGARIRQLGKQHAGEDADPYKRIPPPEYFAVLAGINVPASGRVRCPSPSHPDRNPSCDVGNDPEQGWICRSCQAGGAIYDLASVLLDGATGQALRGEGFKRARGYVHDAFGELT